MSDAQNNIARSIEENAPKPLTVKAVKSLADSIYETLKNEGCEEKDIIGVSSQLISLVTAKLEK